jgi:hypothetical protein
MQQVFSGRMLNHKWTKTVRNMAVGDIVYLAEAENDDPTYRLGQIVEACPGEDGCVHTVRVQYTNPGMSEEKRPPPKTTTRPIHKVAVMVPVEYAFEDDTCDSEVGMRGRKRDLKTKEEAEAEAAEALKRGPARAKAEEPGTGGVQPAVRKRRGRPKKSEKQATTEDKPRTGARNDADAAADSGAPLEAGGQPPTVRRGRSRDLGLRGQRDRGQSC